MNHFNILKKKPSNIYYFFVGLLYVLYAVTFLGIYYVEPKYTEYLSIFIRFFVAVILIIRFNPLYKVTCSESDRILISAAAFFLLVNMGITEILFRYIEIAQKKIL